MNIRLSPLAGVALAALLVGLESFLRFSSNGSMKATSLVFLVGGCLLLGLRSWSKEDILGKVTVAVLFGCYLAAAAARFQGLAKEAYPLDGISVLRLGLVGFLSVGVPVAGLGALVALRRRLSRRGQAARASGARAEGS